ncbi:21427_t:CDS:1, partial [Gigaspora margarita]
LESEKARPRGHARRVQTRSKIRTFIFSMKRLIHIDKLAIGIIYYFGLFGFIMTVGPYEVLFSYKSFFELFVNARDFESSALVEKFAAQLQDIDNSLQCLMNIRIKISIVVVNELSAGVDGNYYYLSLDILSE